MPTTATTTAIALAPCLQVFTVVTAATAATSSTTMTAATNRRGPRTGMTAATATRLSPEVWGKQKEARSSRHME